MSNTINLTAHVRKDMNKEIIIVNGVKHYINRYDLIIDNLDRDAVFNQKVVDEQHIPYEDGYFVIKKYDTGLYNYGYMCNNEADRPGHGGLWSSSASSVYNETGHDFVDVLAQNCVFALPMEQAKNLVPEGYFITKLGSKSWYECSKDTPVILSTDNGYITE